MSSIGRTGDLPDDSNDDSNDDRDDTQDIERDASTPSASPRPNPPRTTKGWFTAPKFGSASSGGGEIEPGPEKD